MYVVTVFVKRVYNLMIYYIPSISISSKCKITLNISDAKKNVLFQGICDKSLQCMDLLSTLLSISSNCMITLNISDTNSSRMKNVLCPGSCEKNLQCMDLSSTIVEYIKQIHDNVKY